MCDKGQDQDAAVQIQYYLGFLHILYNLMSHNCIKHFFLVIIAAYLFFKLESNYGEDSHNRLFRCAV